MIKSKLFRVLALTMVFVMAMAMTGCVQKPPEMERVNYTVCVTNGAGTPMEKCKVDVYKDSGLSSLIYSGITNKNGQISFADIATKSYVAVVSKVHAGYQVADYYSMTGERTDIVLRPGTLTDDDMETVRYSLGDPVMDFSVTTSDGEVTLSELLEEKKAVVLNFWFMNCAPCKMEFPYIQEGYEQLSDEIAVLALNPVDSTDAEIAKFREDKGYTFTMAKCDFRWQEMLEIKGYPTTLVIDRYGNICLIHSGGIESTQDFLDMVNYFIQDDYEQAFFKSPGQIPVVTE